MTCDTKTNYYLVWHPEEEKFILFNGIQHVEEFLTEKLDYYGVDSSYELEEYKVWRIKVSEELTPYVLIDIDLRENLGELTIKNFVGE